MKTFLIVTAICFMFAGNIAYADECHNIKHLSYEFNVCNMSNGDICYISPDGRAVCNFKNK